MLGWRDQRGQASVELVGVLPFCVFACAVVWQLALAGHAAWAVGSAARAAARADAVGSDPSAAARGALPESLERGLKVRTDEGVVRATVRIPAVGGLLALGGVSASARFEPQAR
jgi:hypothetical protein